MSGANEQINGVNATNSTKFRDLNFDLNQTNNQFKIKDFSFSGYPIKHSENFDQGSIFKEFISPDSFRPMPEGCANKFFDEI